MKDFIFEVCRWLVNTHVGTTIRESTWLFPVIETVHIFGIISLVGAASVIDLRLLGWGFRSDPVTKLASRYLPWVWTGFAIQVSTGILLFASEATRMIVNKAFLIKMAMIAVAGLNAFVFHTIAYKSVNTWDADLPTPISARLAGTISILLWFGIVSAGRWIAYV